MPARDPITGFRDLAWGASEEALRTTLDTKYCGESGDPTLNYGTRLCHAEGEVPFGDVHGTWVRFYFRDGGLSGWSALYPARDRTTLLLALKQRYGDPVKETSSKVLWSSAKAGVSFTPGSTYDSLYVLTVFEMERHKAEVMAKAGKTAKGF